MARRRAARRQIHPGSQRIYGFDTGFVSQARGSNPLRPDDCGLLWVHLVLEHLQAHLPGFQLHYCRDKTGREVDFVMVRNRDQVDAIECKRDASEFDAAGLKAFRGLYPKGNNYLISPLTVPAYLKQAGTLEIKVCDPSSAIRDAERNGASPAARGRVDEVACSSAAK